MPINLANMPKVDQAVSTMKKVNEYIAAGMETTIDVAVDFVENDGQDEQKISELKDGMLMYTKMEQDLKQYIAAVEACKSETVEDISDIDCLLAKKLDEIKSGSKDSTLEQHEKYCEMVQRIWEVQHPDEDPTTIQESQPIGDEDVAFTQELISTKCPYTGLEMVNPMKNKICGHSYDREGVMQLIKTRGKKARCPVSLCSNTKTLVMNDMEDNLDMRRIIDRKNRQAGRRTKRT